MEFPANGAAQSESRRPVDNPVRAKIFGFVETNFHLCRLTL
jgi:hypothetical protein